MRTHSSERAHGAALVTVLFLMLAVLMMSVSGTRAALAAVKSARHERDRHIAHHAAQAALRDAERDIAGAAGPASPRTAIFVAAQANAFIAGCAGAGEHAGLCRFVPAPGTPAWQATDLAGAASVEYGRFTGAAMPTGAGLLPARPPRYIVELLASAAPSAEAGPEPGAEPGPEPGPEPAAAPGPAPGSGPDSEPRPEPGSNPGAGPIYRITAIGFGAGEATRVVLQGYYRRASASTPARRLGWREVANWPELHAATL